MSKNVTTMKLGEGKKKSQTDWERLDALKDEDIDYSDIPELDEHFWANAKVVMPPGKKQLTLRIDEDVLAWMKGQGRGYQSRINAILRAYYEAHRDEHSDRKR
jgi:uncharacterized protein (DUF4415 family)